MLNAVALGTFDGLHRGHLSVLSIPDGFDKTALIFSLPPKQVKTGDIHLLLTPEEKIKKFEELGFRVETLNFDEVKHLSPEEFLQFIKKELNPKLISCGFNYHFGFKGMGNSETLKKFCEENGITLRLCDPVCEEGEPISSSRIRNHLKKGEIEKANLLLGYDFSFTAPVIKGDGRGKTLGFPTINQAYPQALAPLKFGVYLSEINIENKIYKGITNIGIRPTFPLNYIISETFIKDFSGDLYEKELKITLKEFIREEKKFSDPTELKNQVLKDIERI